MSFRKEYINMLETFGKECSPPVAGFGDRPCLTALTINRLSPIPGIKFRGYKIDRPPGGLQAFLYPKQFMVNYKSNFILKNFPVTVPGHWRVYHLMDEKIKRKLNTLIESLMPRDQKNTGTGNA